MTERLVPLETALAAIDQEPELPGDMPPEMREAIRNDRDAMTAAFVAAVRETKAGIRERLAELTEEGTTW